jgi:hypothetical protein
MCSTREADPDLLLLHSSLSWVRQHEYDAPETELQDQLDIALRCAIGTLDRFERAQRVAGSGYAANQPPPGARAAGPRQCRSELRP